MNGFPRRIPILAMCTYDDRTTLQVIFVTPHSTASESIPPLNRKTRAGLLARFILNTIEDGERT